MYTIIHCEYAIRIRCDDALVLRRVDHPDEPASSLLVPFGGPARATTAGLEQLQHTFGVKPASYIHPPARKLPELTFKVVSHHLRVLPEWFCGHMGRISERPNQILTRQLTKDIWVGVTSEHLATTPLDLMGFFSYDVPAKSKKDRPHLFLIAVYDVQIPPYPASQLQEKAAGAHSGLALVTPGDIEAGQLDGRPMSPAVPALIAPKLAL